MDELASFVVASKGLIARGMGRSYGDSALSKTVVSMCKFDRLIDFDPLQGILTCEAGVSVADIVDIFVSRGWFLPVVPGTKFVSIGGAVASDVHGKNHHKDGSFANCISSFKLLMANGDIVQCSRQERAPLFYATIGGMGLTGIILQVTLFLKRIPSAHVRQRVFRAANLKEAMGIFEANLNATYSVAWIDCLARRANSGRSLVMFGEHAGVEELPLEMSKKPLQLVRKRKIDIPFEFPSGALNRHSVKAFNWIYYNFSSRRAESLVDLETFFFPLDSLLNWNRIYGKKGFVQYQVAFPLASSREGLTEILSIISQAGLGSFLAVLKYLGGGRGGLSFPINGYTLALDLPYFNTLPGLLAKLDVVTREYGGRLYLTKDSRMAQQLFDATYGEAVNHFRALRREIDPQSKISSLQSIRLGL
ncbi:FAD binding oxidase [Oleiphilus messinensis]|uniref:FAD binding oxidase n=1 Tax=Oleiphilus messinensis TaxID=141451 RepID=A0A1Y0I722_9GAMM|nr:FAD-binding oxidoreductase [Oleiphilus messinensis]ARU56020.1 FAD binding oxidase [Oleiphilus messinensis]